MVKNHFTVIFWVDSVTEGCGADYGILWYVTSSTNLLIMCLFHVRQITCQPNMAVLTVEMWVAQCKWTSMVISRIPFSWQFKVPKLSATFRALHVVPFFPFIGWCYLVGTQVQTIPQRCMYVALQDVCLLCQLMKRHFRLCSVQIWSVLFSYGGVPDHLMSTTDPLSCNLAISCCTVL